MFDLFHTQKQRLYEIRDTVQRTSRYFHALALARAYADMVDLMMLRLRGHPEVARVPDLLTVMLEHFQLYPQEHINVETDTIFNRSSVGTIATLEEWQQAGYPLERGEDTYARRVLMFEAIWRQVPVTLVVQRVSKRGKPFKQRVTFQPRVQESPYPVATYENIIASRNAQYASLVRTIPMWLPLNYGTAGLGTNPGYPSVPGAHFVDVAEQLVQVRKGQTRALITRYYADALRTFSIPDVYTWSQAAIPHYRSVYINVFSIAALLV